MGAARRENLFARALLSLASLALVVVTWLPGCGTDAVGVDACESVESARCRAAPGCGVPLEPPYSASGTDVDACIRYYDIACLHGLASGVDPGSAAVAACVAAISAHPCPAGGANLVQQPELDPKCAWLIPPSSAVDASDEMTPAEASSEADVSETGD